jgi:hypothetical protein
VLGSGRRGDDRTARARPHRSNRTGPRGPSGSPRTAAARSKCLADLPLCEEEVFLFRASIGKVAPVPTVRGAAIEPQDSDPTETTRPASANGWSGGKPANPALRCHHGELPLLDASHTFPPPTQILRHLKSTPSSLGPNAKPPPGTQPSGVCHHLENLCGAELFLTPRPSRPADPEGEGVRLMLPLGR